MTTPQAALGKVSKIGNAAGSIVTPGGKQPKVKTPLGSAPVIPLILFGIGGYLMWFGVHYFRDEQMLWPTGPVKSVLQGNGVPAPSPLATAGITLDAYIPGEGAADAAAAAAAATPGGTGGGTVTSSKIANDALKYEGHCYLYGGAPGPDGKGCWDCSSFCNWVLGHDEKIAIPGYAGGTYDGSEHGPATVDYLLYGTAVSRADVAAGDLCVYQTHMGIAISNTEMISAEDPQNGTRKSSIDGMTASLGEQLFCRRAEGATATSGSGGHKPT